MRTFKQTMFLTALITSACGDQKNPEPPAPVSEHCAPRYKDSEAHYWSEQVGGDDVLQVAHNQAAVPLMTVRFHQCVADPSYYKEFVFLFTYTSTRAPATPDEGVMLGDGSRLFRRGTLRNGSGEIIAGPIDLVGSICGDDHCGRFHYTLKEPTEEERERLWASPVEMTLEADIAEIATAPAVRESFILDFGIIALYQRHCCPWIPFIYTNLEGVERGEGFKRQLVVHKP